MAGDYILIVDDNQDQREILRTALDMSGYRSVLVTNGQEAMEQIAREKPRVILLDLMMPEMSGFEVLRRLEGQFPDAPIPVIVISAYLEPDSWDMAGAGFVGLPGVVKMIAKGNFYVRALLAAISEVTGTPEPAWIKAQTKPFAAR